MPTYLGNQRPEEEDPNKTPTWMWIIILIFIAYMGIQMGRAFVFWNWPYLGGGM